VQVIERRKEKGMTSVGKTLLVLFLFGCMMVEESPSRVRVGASVRFISSLEIETETETETLELII
jgi:allophanate hydrolase subunit 1